MVTRKRGSRFAFRTLFGRRTTVALQKVELENTNEALWSDPLVRKAYEQLAAPRRKIETTIDDPALVQKFMDRVIGQWHALGEAEPHWSNMPLKELKRETIDASALDGFYESGTHWMTTLDAFESRSGVKINNGICLELGAGAGRFTHALAQRFEHVIAVDISAGGLRACKARVDQLGLKNVTLSLLTSPDDLTAIGPIDFFLSLSTLQHNPPPVQKLLLDRALDNVVVGGFALFQTPDWLDGYSFSSESYLNDAPDASCDCHCLPKTAVLDLLEAHRMRLLDFAPDFTVEEFGSYHYFARKQQSPGQSDRPN